MILQETLFGLNERTKFIDAPDIKAKKSLSNHGPREDGNKSHIVRIAEQFSLSQQQVNDELFSNLKTKHGRYSINDAVTKIMEMKSNSPDDSDELTKEKNDNACPPDGEDKEKLDLLGSRVRTVMEDGREYEGTITDIHYRVTYDCGEDTETFVSEAEAYENLACNDKINDFSIKGTRCNVLEIFSGRQCAWQFVLFL